MIVLVTDKAKRLLVWTVCYIESQPTVLLSGQTLSLQYRIKGMLVLTSDNFCKYSIRTRNGHIKEEREGSSGRRHLLV